MASTTDASWNARLLRTLDLLKTNATALVVSEGIAAVLLVSEAGALMWWHASLAGPVQVLLWAQLLALAAYLRWAGLFPLFGPVLVYDLVRTARRNRYFYVRVLYASLLSIMLFWGYFLVYSEAAHRNTALRNNDLAQFSSGFFYAYLIVQFSLVILLTPAYTAGAIAEEKERKTLPFLLATDLRDREIILGKLLSRLLNLTLFVLTGLPILSFLQFMGGVDPGLLLAGFAATGLTMLGLGALSMLNSVLTKRARDAIVMTYVEGFGYVALSGASWLLLLIPGAATFPSFGNWVSPITVQDFIEWFNAGNLLAIMIEIWRELVTGGRLDLLVPRLLRNYALFTGLVTVVSLGWAITRMRPQALAEASEAARVRRGIFPSWPRPRVGTWPMIWKELFVERGLRLHWLARIVLGLVLIASFLPIAAIVADYLRMRNYNYGPGWGGFDAWRRFVEEMNVWARIVGAGIGCLMLLGVAVRAAGSISGERDKGTLNELLATPLGSDAILFSKWLGSLLSVRWAWVWLFLVWITAGAVTALHPVAVPLMIAAWFVYAAFLACLGLWFSMVCRTTLRAIVWTLITGLLLFVGHWLIWLLFIPFFLGRPPDALEWVAKFQVGLTPPLALGACFPITLEQSDFDGPFRREWLQMMAFGIMGIVFWGIAAVILWGVVSARFREMTNRSLFSRVRVVRTAPHPRLRSAVVSRNGAASHPVRQTAEAEIVDALPAEPDEETILDALRVEEPHEG